MLNDFFSKLLPGFMVKNVAQDDEQIILEAQPIHLTALCPSCHTSSSRIHSYYWRHPHDLPLCHLAVRLRLSVRRFRCLNPLCQRQTFAEQLPQFLARYARRTERLINSLYHLSQALGGIAAARLSQHLRMMNSTDTLLRLLRRKSVNTQPAPVRVLGVDDWAMRKRVTYGTILADLERHRVVDLLEDRTSATLASWLKKEPAIEVITRDRSTEYALGSANGAPQAMQVADRWHLLQNLSNMLEKWLNRIYKRVKQIILPPSLLYRIPFFRTHSEDEASQASRQRRLERYTEIQQRKHDGQNILQISYAMNLHRETVRTYYYADAFPERQARPVAVSILDPYVPYLEVRCQQGCSNASQLWREIQEQGFSGSRRMVLQWMKPHRKQPAASTPKKYLEGVASRQSNSASQKGKFPPIREIVWLFTKKNRELFSTGRAIEKISLPG